MLEIEGLLVNVFNLPKRLVVGKH